jgi:hypothetical protein
MLSLVSGTGPREGETNVENKQHEIEVGDLVEGGHGDDYDVGRVEQINGDVAFVAWEIGVKTTAPVANLSLA